MFPVFTAYQDGDLSCVQLPVRVEALGAVTVLSQAAHRHCMLTLIKVYVRSLKSRDMLQARAGILLPGSDPNKSIHWFLI